ncbi:phospholipid carrier-dependent glycosyltransferase [Nodularia spumigena CS-584]|jgi:dolichyl-phosphate-mannose-protein mannosyltransferase|uniref:Polyprenol-phosphate-mannose--protein mannosyltransferase n=2 Tax=Nodularia spumigena TaxID=70799 RepID=A0A2S0Q6I5_NODSP|nr:phospholipid carrier-dependent glycosyltransferase [Nodularia spumigena]AHJ27596.1 conserved membrane protein [Nodularia spumigena CCY9414]AVZ30049.1 putative dolichyl-phosphate-mannose--protein mannosyltransferase [Nodularia spumigena UHCC 0039]MDB9342220.1 phospholipid carrier-dependent glycosyltransferase [Nodularia spumigena CS-588/06]MDB9371539.1 phospholipid carrier-dependent glycosyltransferase [Nodularia spumigena CS-586/05]MDB9381896.1 phospholipid carrier-dependent glycosyltransfe
MTKKWFQIGILGVFLLSLCLRFWGLERFNTLVFDEVYFAKFGNNYLTNTPFFNAHPPLSQYIIGIGIWMGSHLPFGQDTVNELTGSVRSPWSYRWLNALTGSFIPLVVAAIAYQLNHRYRFALLAGLFTACDGFFLVESRYALNNIYIIIFGLLGQWFLLLGLNHQNQQRYWYLVLAGVSFGASVATKWNGLWFLLGAYLIWIAAYIIRGIQSFPDNPNLVTSPATVIRQTKIFLNNWYRKWVDINRTSPEIALQTPLQKLTQINIFQMLFYLGIIPAIVYSIIWIPHLQLDRRYGFIAVHQKILSFHLQMGGNSADVHPYCAAWYKWPLMNRPIAYYYQTAESINQPLSVLQPPLPPGTEKIIYDVHAMGNPFLWWFGVAAILFLAVMLVLQVVIPWLQKKQLVVPANMTVNTWMSLYLILNYAANLLPWVKVTRCVFMYHYMSAVVFVFLAIAWLVDQCLSSYYREIRAVGISITFLILAAFIFWMPIYLGLPLSPESYKIRMWFNTWI